MSTEPVSLQIVKLSPQSTAINILRDLLKMAEEGSIRSLAVAAGTMQGGTLHAHTFGDGNVAHLLGAVEITKLHMLRQIEEAR